jgi:uncharacterized protein
MKLTAAQARVLGSLVEKQLTTPQQYPLTLASLVAACNQTTNREPVVSYDDATVTGAVSELKELRLVRSVLPSHGRSVVRYRHVLDETLALNSPQCALLAVLLLRGPQTVGELRIRTDRMAEFDGLEAIEHELAFLASREEALAANVGRRPGQKEERWGSPLVDLPSGEASVAAHHLLEEDRPTAPVSDLRADVNALAAEVRELRRQLEELRSNLGG